MTTEPQQGPTRRAGIPVDSFGNRLMLARAYAGHLSIREAAELCDLGRGAWTNWEKGARPADIIDIATVVADKLGVDRDWLLFGGPLAEAEGRPRRRELKHPKIPVRHSTITESQTADRSIAPRGRTDQRRPRSAGHPSMNRPRGARPTVLPRPA